MFHYTDWVTIATVLRQPEAYLIALLSGYVYVYSTTQTHDLRYLLNILCFEGFPA